MKPEELSFYRDLLGDIKIRVRQGQRRAALSANAEMIHMYWDIGRMIAARQEKEGWGAGVIPRLAVDLKNELPDQKGFSERNIGRMIAFFREYSILPQPAAKFTGADQILSIGAQPAPQFSDAPILPRPVAKFGKISAGDPGAPIVQQPAAQLQSTDSESVEIVPQSAAQLPLPPHILFGLPWFHHVILIQKLKDLPTRYWYAKQAFEQGWTRDTLTLQIKNRAHERQGAAITNFATTLPEAHAAIAQGLLKDPYLFDFLTLEEPFHERELETGLLLHLEKFLLELGRGFAFVGRQHRIEVSDREFYLDLLFYHLHLRCFIVVDLKKGDFKPEYAGKMNFYCSAVDDLLRHEHDVATIGLILCQTKDRILAEYSLRDIHKPIGLADYELTRALPKELASSLPSIEDIEAELSQDLGKEEKL
jgi:predicted nuclease of restriction endonuclease-like (RecB) superfamily